MRSTDLVSMTLLLAVSAVLALVAPASIASADESGARATSRTPFHARSTTTAGGIAGAPGEPCGGCEVLIDDGSKETDVGLTNGGFFVWAVPYDVAAGACDTVCGVGVMIGPVEASTPITIHLYDDPNDDGNPNDAILLTSADRTSANENVQVLNYYAFDSPVAVEGVYFVAVSIEHSFGELPAALDETDSQGISWINFGAPSSDPLPGGAQVLENVGLGGNWLLHAVGGGEAGGSCVEDTNSDGIVDVQDLVSVLLDWGTDGSMNNADITGDGVVDVQDLTAVILAWGVCPIANDTCATATSVTGGSFGFNNIGADTDGVAFNCGAGFHDVWWTYVAEDDGVLNLDTCGSSFDTILEVFAGTGCPSGALIGCNDDAVSGSCAGSMQSSVSVDVQAGDPVLIRVGGVGGAEGTGTLNVTLAEDVLPPPNDDCADAIDLATNVPFTGTTNGATASSEAGLCGPPVTGPGVWFTVTGTGGELQATLCGAADFDTLLTIYCGPCGNIRCVLGDDDGCGVGGGGSEATWCSVVGIEYLVHLSGFNGSTGDFELLVTETGTCSDPDACMALPTVENDECIDALPIELGDTPYDTTGATTDGLPHLACEWDGQTYQDIWYTYTPPMDGVLQLSTCDQAIYDTDLVIYTADVACPPGDEALVGCNDDAEGCSNFTSLLQVAVEAGTEYLIRVGGFSLGSQGEGILSLELLASGNDTCEFAQHIEAGEVVNGDSSQSTPDEGVPDCGGGAQNGPGDWYTFTGDGTEMTVSLCDSGFQFDTRLNVYCGGSCGAFDCSTLVCAALEFPNNCAGIHESMTICTTLGGTYAILVSGNGASDSGPYTLEVTSGPPCEEPACGGGSGCGEPACGSGGVLASAPLDLLNPLGATQVPNGDILVVDFSLGLAQYISWDGSAYTTSPAFFAPDLETITGVAYNEITDSLWWLELESDTLTETDLVGVPTGETVPVLGLSAGAILAGITHDPSLNFYFAVDIANDEVITMTGTAQVISSAPQSCLAGDGSVFGNAVDSINGNVEVLAGPAAAGEATVAIPIDNNGNTNGPVTDLLPAADGFINNIIRDRSTPTTVMHLIGDGNNRIYAVTPAQ